MKSYMHIINDLMLVEDRKDTLENAQQLINSLQIFPKYPIILIGGTNGKGSTCAYLTNILLNAGYKVGTFTSPHIFQYNERIKINNTLISDDDLLDYLEKIALKSNYKLGFFKTLTLATHLYFMHEKVDIAIVEVGIGGKNDVTNLFEPAISAVTCVDFDHCHILGNDLNAIGLEKAHIYREGKWAFFGAYNPPRSLIEYAKSICSKLETLGTDFDVVCNELSFDVWCNNNNFYTLPYPSLRGKEQVYNVALSLAILSKLRHTFPVTIGNIKNALLQTKLIGRFQVMPGQPQVIFDVAHNPQAVQKMLQNMVKLPFAKQNIAVFGICNDKDVEKILELTHNVFQYWHIDKLNSDRGLESKKLKEILLKHKVHVEQVFEHQNITFAMKDALSIVKDSERIVCFGSFLTVEEAYKEYKEYKFLN
jgi:dihydrofolate synthase/folylpolyglutamate synthase